MTVELGLFNLEIHWGLGEVFKLPTSPENRHPAHEERTAVAKGFWDLSCRKALDSVVARISTLGPIVSWLFREIRNPCGLPSRSSNQVSQA